MNEDVFPIRHGGYSSNRKLSKDLLVGGRTTHLKNYEIQLDHFP